MDLGEDQNLEAPLLIASQSLRSIKAGNGSVNAEEINLHEDFSSVKVPNNGFQSGIWSPQSKCEVIASLFELESMKQGESLNIPQISTLLEEFINLQELKPISQRPDTLQSTAMISEIIRSPRNSTETAAWAEVVSDRLKIIDLKKESDFKSYTIQDTKTQQKIEKIEKKTVIYELNEINYEKILQNELQRQKTKLLTGHSKSVRSVCVSPNGKLYISGSDDTTIKIWNVQERIEEFTLSGHINCVNSVCISSDGKLIISGSDDNTIKA